MWRTSSTASERKCVQEPDIQVLVSCHVEIVVLFSKGEISSKKEKVGFITEAE